MQSTKHLSQRVCSLFADTRDLVGHKEYPNYYYCRLLNYSACRKIHACAIFAFWMIF